MIEENIVKSDPTELDLKIIRQIEYYFGDFNLGKDKFLKETIEKNEGWVELATLTTFNRLKSLTTDIETIANALRKSESGLLEIHESGSKIRRSADKPLPENDEKHREELIQRSVYVKGFPDSLTLDELLDFFKQITPDVEHIQMLYRDKKFRGAVFTVFVDLDKAKEFLNRNDFKFKDSELKMESRPDYRSRKQCEWNKKKEEKKSSKKEKEDNKSATHVEKVEIEKGCVIHLNAVPNETKREDLKEFFNNHGTVAWVDFSRGDKEAWIRFQEANQAVVLQDKIVNDGLKLTIKDTDLQIRVLEGDEEIEYWDKLAKSKQEGKLKKNKGKRGKTGWGRRGGKKREFGEERSFESKRAKIESD